MIKGFFLTTWRNFRKNKAFSLLNIIGLAIGIACASIILLWVEYYTTYNHAVKNLNQIYQVNNTQVYGKDMHTFPVTPFGIREDLLQNYPQVEKVVRYQGYFDVNVNLGDKQLTQQGGYADPEFLEMFSYNILRGNGKTALNAPDGVAISAKVAQAYFGSIDAIGKTLDINKQPYQVKAVFKDPPENMSFQEQVILPYEVYYQQNKNSGMWGSNVTGAWVQLKNGASLAQVNKQMAGLIKSHNSNSNNTLFLYPMERLALHGVFSNGQEVDKGMITTVRTFTLIAFIILIIACINFMNLSTARSENRAREIGLRKVMGSTRKALIFRLIAEAIIMSFTALIVGVLLIVAILPMFNGLIGLHLQLGLFNIKHLGFLLALGLLTGLLAGCYPAFYLSSFNPIAALKGKGLKAGGAGMIRKILVVLQFSVSAIIIVAIFVIYHQIQHVRHRDLGFNKDNVLYLSSTEKLSESFTSLKQALMQTGQVSSVAQGSHTPMEMYNNGGGLSWKGKQENQDVLVTYVKTDNNYLNTFNIPLASGRQFYANPMADSNGVIINETLAKLMGDEGHVGGQLYYGDPSNGAMTIVGITKNFVYNSMTVSNPAPLMFFNWPDNAEKIFIRLKDNKDLPATLSTLKTVFAKFDASQAFDYHFMDKTFETKFKQDRFTGSLAIIFGGLAIIISCLGLFGLSAFMAEQRTREIGIRKVMGASVGSVVKLLTRDFIIMVLLSCVIAFPIAFYLMDQWLTGYEYRISIHWYVFAVTALVTLLIAFMTVSFQAFKAGRLNPVKAIQSE